MTDILIRGLSAAAVAHIDAAAAAQGLSRSEYLRRWFERQASSADAPPKVTISDLRRASEAAQDLLDDNLMRRAWG